MSMHVVGLCDNGVLVAYRFITEIGVFDLNKNCAESKLGFLDTKTSLPVTLIHGEYVTIDEGSSHYFDAYYENGLINYVKEYLVNEGRNITIVSGDGLDDTIREASAFRHRYCLDAFDHYVYNRKCIFVMLFGVRRTGKTSMIHQEIAKLLERGVSKDKIALLTPIKNGIDSKTLYSIVRFLLKFGIDYMFIDEVTYCKDDTNFFQAFIDNPVYKGKKIILSGTESAGLCILRNGVLYDRENSVHTTYISYSEYNYLYPDASIDDYISSGGILHDTDGYEEAKKRGIKDHSIDVREYVRTSIVGNIKNCFEKYDYVSFYPDLQKMYNREGGRLDTLINKWLQRNGEELVLRMIRKRFKSDDFGNLRDLLQRRDIELDHDIYDELERCLLEKIIVKTDQELSPYTDEDIDSVVEFLREIDCLVEFKNCQYLLPLELRYGFTCICIDILRNHLYDFDTDFVDELIKIMDHSVRGGLLEEIVYVDLYKKGINFRKYNYGGGEIDLVIGTDLYEIKHSDKQVIDQCRWLLNPVIQNNLHFTSLNVLYNGEDKDVELSEYDYHISKLPENREEVSDQLRDNIKNANREKHVIHYFNVSKWLSRMTGRIH